ADKAEAQEKERCISEGVDVLVRNLGTNQRTVNTKCVVSHFKENSLKLLTADKEGGFVVVGDALFSEKSRQAIEKHFRLVHPVSLPRIKTQTKSLCQRLELATLVKKVQASKKLNLSVFFTAKTHKTGCPFRAIVTERDSWQREVGGFLCRHLSVLKLGDPFLVRNSEEIIEFLHSGDLRGTKGFSIDVEDLFYSVPHDQMLVAVQTCIEDNGEVQFRSSTGITVEGFLELLTHYLRYTLVSFEGELFVQKRGICIGSKVAPVLCEIFLASCDRAIEKVLEQNHRLTIFRYVDFLVLNSDPVDLNEDKTVSGVLEVFKSCAAGLSFTHETASSGRLQFLDLGLFFEGDHVCWAYEPRSKKKLLPYDSAHSKLVKRGIASSCMAASLKKSCPHNMNSSFQSQLVRLQDVGFPPRVLCDVAEGLVKKLKRLGRGEQAEGARRESRPVVMPYVHKVSHNLKKVANRFRIPVVFSAPNKLSALCKTINKKEESGEVEGVCNKRHATKFRECAIGVTYEIPLSCGRVYVGQTGRCINDRIREHSAATRQSPSGH
ncbi:unnamed protein product, partial [Ixodes persulcatus]